MVQWRWPPSWISFGVHIDFARRFVPRAVQYYGPYVDLHFLCFIFSVGRNPYYSSAWEGIISAGRGGEIVK